MFFASPCFTSYLFASQQFTPRLSQHNSRNNRDIIKKNGTANLAITFMICPVSPGNPTCMNTTKQAATAFTASRFLFLIDFSPVSYIFMISVAFYLQPFHRILKRRILNHRTLDHRILNHRIPNHRIPSLYHIPQDSCCQSSRPYTHNTHTLSKMPSASFSPLSPAVLHCDMPCVKSGRCVPDIYFHLLFSCRQVPDPVVRDAAGR